jgi:hypothetical protein
MPDTLIESLAKWLLGRGYKPYHDAPLSTDADNRAYWSKSDKHKEFTSRDSDFLRCYVMFSLAAATPFAARGINVPGRGYVRPDVAVMNSAINAEMVALEDGLFKLTRTGLTCLGLTVPT